MILLLLSVLVLKAQNVEQTSPHSQSSILVEGQETLKIGDFPEIIVLDVLLSAGRVRKVRPCKPIGR
jgi:hypothetical protein